MQFYKSVDGSLSAASAVGVGDSPEGVARLYRDAAVLARRTPFAVASAGQ